MGPEYPGEQAEHLIEGVNEMIVGIRGIEESRVDQSLFARREAKRKADGEARGIAEDLLRMGRTRPGVPDERIEAAVMAISNRERLLHLIDRLGDASSWDVVIGPESP